MVKNQTQRKVKSRTQTQTGNQNGGNDDGNDDDGSHQTLQTLQTHQNQMAY